MENKYTINKTIVVSCTTLFRILSRNIQDTGNCQEDLYEHRFEDPIYKDVFEEQFNSAVKRKTIK